MRTEALFACLRERAANGRCCVRIVAGGANGIEPKSRLAKAWAAAAADTVSATCVLPLPPWNNVRWSLDVTEISLLPRGLAGIPPVAPADTTSVLR
jgi:hypothetical protein